MSEFAVVEVLSAETCYTLREFSQHGGVSTRVVVELVEHGVIEPLEETPPADWRFDLRALQRLRCALRLQRDLQMDFAGLAMSLDLLDEVQQLRQEVDQLQRRLDALLGD